MSSNVETDFLNFEKGGTPAFENLEF